MRCTVLPSNQRGRRQAAPLRAPLVALPSPWPIQTSSTVSSSAPARRPGRGHLPHPLPSAHRRGRCRREPRALDPEQPQLPGLSVRRLGRRAARASCARRPKATARRSRRAHRRRSSATARASSRSTTGPAPYHARLVLLATGIVDRMPSVRGRPARRWRKRSAPARSGCAPSATATRRATRRSRCTARWTKRSGTPCSCARSRGGSRWSARSRASRRRNARRWRAPRGVEVLPRREGAASRRGRRLRGRARRRRAAAAVSTPSIRCSAATRSRSSRSRSARASTTRAS